jgi:diadenosine tetraphosphate (Ap4A) HIT family hydrolase
VRLIDGLLFVARTRPGSWLARLFWRLLPIDKLTSPLLDGQHWQAFEHPRPEYPLHILLVPHQPFRDVLALKDADPAILRDFLALVAELVRQYRLDECGYRLITNGGKYQDVRLLHFHLVADGHRQHTDT